MKVKSKKDDYIVKCETINESSEVKFFLNGHRTQVLWKFICSHKDSLKSYDFLNEQLEDLDSKYRSLPIISFDYWQNLPDVPKPEYEPKDVAFNQRKVIGYKLIKPEYKEAAKIIALSHMGEKIKYYKGNIETIGVKNGAPCKKALEEAGVLSLWFEPIYDTSITLKSGVKLSEDDIAEVKELIEMRQVCKDLAKEKKY